MIRYNHPFTEDGRKDRPIYFSQRDVESSVYPADRLASSNLVHMFLSSSELTACIMEIAPGGTFDPPDCHPGDEVYYILEGSVLVFNPASGQSVEAKEREAVIIPKDALHTGYNFHDTSVKALAFIAPKSLMDEMPQASPKLFPINNGKEAADAAPYPSFEAKRRFGGVNDLGSWPFDGSALRKDGVIVDIKEDQKLRIIHGKEHPILMKFSVSNDYLQVGEYILSGGGSMTTSHSEPLVHGGCAFLFGLKSPAAVILPESEAVYILKEGEGLYLPPDTEYQLANYGNKAATLVFAVAKRL